MTDEELMKTLGQVVDELVARRDAGNFNPASDLADAIEDVEKGELRVMMMGSMLYAAQECLPT